MDPDEEKDFAQLNLSEKIVFVLKSNEAFGGPQSAARLEKFLNIFEF